jgi:hypothetical protein
VNPNFRDPIPLLQAIATLISDSNLRHEEIQVTFLGGGSYVDSKEFSESVKLLGLDKVVKVSGRVSHQEALRRLQHAAVLLILQASDDTRSLIPAKAFEYLRIKRPILALTLEGATADLLGGMDSCYVVDPTDQSSLKQTVMLLYRLWQQSPNELQVSRPIQRYERSNLTAELAMLLEDLAPKALDT